MRKNRPLIEMPRIIDIRYNALENLTNIFEKLNIKGKVMVVTGNNTMKIMGERVINIIEDIVNINTYKIHTDNLEESETLFSILNEDKIDIALAIGGGKVIDSVKYATFLQNIPFISIPTVTSHDGIASSRAHLTGIEKLHSLNAHNPLVIIGDIETISNAPSRYNHAGIGDLLANISAVYDWELSNRITGEHISKYAVAMSRIAAQSVIDNIDIIAKDRIQAAYIILKGLITSAIAMNIAGNSRPGSGSEHMIAHMLSNRKDNTALHGELCGLAAIITTYLHGENWKPIRDTLSKIKAPVFIQDLGLTNDMFVDAMINATKVRNNRFTILNAGISKIAAIKALENTNITLEVRND